LLVIPKVVSKPAKKGQPLLIPRPACNNSIGVAEEQRSAEWTKNCNLVLYMTLRTMLALCFQLDWEGGRKNSKFDRAAASISKWTNKCIGCRLCAPRHIVLQHKYHVSIKQSIKRKK
jgi:hypothetical protein